MEPAFEPPEDHASLKAVANFFFCSSVHGATSFGLTIWAFSLPEDFHNCLLNLPASTCSDKVCLNAEIGER